MDKKIRKKIGRETSRQLKGHQTYIWTVRKQMNKQTSNPRAKETSRQVVRVTDSYLLRGQHVERKVGSEDSRLVLEQGANTRRGIQLDRETANM